MRYSWRMLGWVSAKMSMSRSRSKSSGCTAASQASMVEGNSWSCSPRSPSSAGRDIGCAGLNPSPKCHPPPLHRQGKTLFAFVYRHLGKLQLHGALLHLLFEVLGQVEGFGFGQFALANLLVQLGGSPIYRGAQIGFKLLSVLMRQRNTPALAIPPTAQPGSSPRCACKNRGTSRARLAVSVSQGWPWWRTATSKR